jgi:hypothetical protein
MSMTEQQEVEVRVLSIKVLKELEQDIRNLVQLEHCRSLRQVVVYLLESALEAAWNQTTLRLIPEHNTGTSLQGHIKVEIPLRLYTSLDIKAAEFGLEVPEIARLLLSRSVEVYRSLPAGLVPNKEEFKRLVERVFEKQNQSRFFSVRFPFFGTFCVWRRENM